ncbi:C-C motif chemokine 25 [Lepus europaeus]|uniref:C-C motif chemokine 25 n=1 Tax=Lepus europaeus TaxID=9983 RepID=UPI002B4AA31C|nr:C-C motif chemokine 25 [Lepus europaeus]
MNSWILACLVVCFVGAWTPAVHTQGVSEDCCLAYHRLPWAVLQRTRGYQLQEVSGSCNLPAVRFCLKHRIVCGNPQDEMVRRAMQLLNTRRKSCHHSQMTLQGRKKPRKSWPPSSKQSSPAGNGKRNATLRTAAKLGL